MGALDSACNRTCCGPTWLEQYRAALEGAPDFVKEMEMVVSECEAFRFGNGSSTPSYARWRLPALLDGNLFLFWVSVVDIPSLGLLLGRDCVEALGVRLDFERKLLDCRRLGVSDFSLEQMRAGHFMLPLLPSDLTNGWGGKPKLSFKRLGLDGVVELALTHRRWWTNMLQTPSRSFTRVRASEFNLTESGLRSAALTLASAVCVGELAPSPAPTARAIVQKAHSSEYPAVLHGGNRRWTSGSRRQMAPNGRSTPCASSVARSRGALVAFATTLLAVLAFPIPLGVQSCGLEAAGREYGEPCRVLVADLHAQKRSQL